MPIFPGGDKITFSCDDYSFYIDHDTIKINQNGDETLSLSYIPKKEIILKTLKWFRHDNQDDDSNLRSPLAMYKYVNNLIAMHIEDTTTSEVLIRIKELLLLITDITFYNSALENGKIIVLPEELRSVFCGKTSIMSCRNDDILTFLLLKKRELEQMLNEAIRCCPVPPWAIMPNFWSILMNYHSAKQTYEPL